MSWFDDNAFVPPSGNTGITGGMPPARMTDDQYRDYFFQTLGVQPGQDASNWQEVLTRSGIPTGFGPGEQANLGQFNGLTQQIGAGGVRGRVFLPSATADANGYYTNPFDVLSTGPDGRLTWAWKGVGRPEGGAGGATGVIGQGLENSPGYQFRLGDGLKALERSAAARGTLLTGGTLKGLERYAQDYASGEYDKRVGQLFNLSSLGQNAAAGVGNAGSAYANNAGDLMTQIGNAQASGRVGSANAYTDAINQGANSAVQNMFLYQWLNGGGRGGMWTPPSIPGAVSGVPAGLPGAVDISSWYPR
jgi:hypothetical protein